MSFRTKTVLVLDTKVLFLDSAKLISCPQIYSFPSTDWSSCRKFVTYCVCYHRQDLQFVEKIWETKKTAGQLACLKLQLFEFEIDCRMRMMYVNLRNQWADCEQPIQPTHHSAPCVYVPAHPIFGPALLSAPFPLPFHSPALPGSNNFDSIKWKQEQANFTAGCSCTFRYYLTYVTLREIFCTHSSSSPFLL